MPPKAHPQLPPPSPPTPLKVVAMAGRCAERLLLGDANVSTAGAGDQYTANRIAREMVFRCGFRWVLLFLRRDLCCVVCAVGCNAPPHPPLLARPHSPAPPSSLPSLPLPSFFLTASGWARCR